MSLTLLVFFYHFFFLFFFSLFLPFVLIHNFSSSFLFHPKGGNGENIAGDKSGDDTEESESDESDEGK